MIRSQSMFSNYGRCQADRQTHKHRFLERNREKPRLLTRGL